VAVEGESAGSYFQKWRIDDENLRWTTAKIQQHKLSYDCHTSNLVDANGVLFSEFPYQRRGRAN
jgi:hypothetical protein